MVYLMLDDPGLKPMDGFSNFLTIRRQGLKSNPLGAGYQTPIPGDAQAAFPAFLEAFGIVHNAGVQVNLKRHGIHFGIAPIAVAFHYQTPFVHPHLVGRKANPT